MTLYADSKELAEKYADQINQKIVGRLKGNEFRKKGDAINTICA
jgi:hypothetical protein